MIEKDDLPTVRTSRGRQHSPDGRSRSRVCGGLSHLAARDPIRSRPHALWCVGDTRMARDLFSRARDQSWLRAVALLLGPAGAIGGSVHSGYDLVNVINPPSPGVQPAADLPSDDVLWFLLRGMVSIGQARTALLAFLGGERSGPTSIRKRAPADLCAGPNRLTRGECNEAAGRRKGSRMEWWPRNASELGVPVTACEREPAVGLPNWKIMRRRTIWFTRKDFGCIRLPIWVVRMEIADLLYRGHGAAQNPRTGTPGGNS
jgi:hypothetical protein